MPANSLEAIATELRLATHPGLLPIEISGVYLALAEVVDIRRTMESATQRLADAVGSLPGIVDGLRVDALGDLIAPEALRDASSTDLGEAAGHPWPGTGRRQPCLAGVQPTVRRR